MWFAYIHCWATDVFSCLWSDLRLCKETPPIVQSMKYKGFKLGGGQAYNRSSDQTAVVVGATKDRA
jgi:hypothetical protein